MNNNDLEKALTLALSDEVRESVGYVDERAEVVIEIIVEFLIRRLNTAIVQFFLRR